MNNHSVTDTGWLDQDRLLAMNYAAASDTTRARTRGVVVWRRGRKDSITTIIGRRRT